MVVGEWHRTLVEAESAGRGRAARIERGALWAPRSFVGEREGRGLPPKAGEPLEWPET